MEDEHSSIEFSFGFSRMLRGRIGERSIPSILSATTHPAVSFYPQPDASTSKPYHPHQQHQQHRGHQQQQHSYQGHPQHDAQKRDFMSEKRASHAARALGNPFDSFCPKCGRVGCTPGGCLQPCTDATCCRMESLAQGRVSQHGGHNNMLCPRTGYPAMQANFVQHRSHNQQACPLPPPPTFPQFTANSASVRSPPLQQIGYVHPQQHGLTFVPESPQMM